MSNEQMSRHDHVLAGLVFSLQAAAMQHLGKVQDPATGEATVDLEQAKGTIDILEMFKAKCRTDTPEELLRILDGAVADLQLNYLDEVKKAKAAADTAQGGQEAPTGDEAPADEGETNADEGETNADDATT